MYVSTDTLIGDAAPGDQARLAELALDLICSGADLHSLDFLRWLVHSGGRHPEWDLRQSRRRRKA